jgi:hypothetical protein
MAVATEIHMNRLLIVFAILMITWSTSPGTTPATDFDDGVAREIRIGILDRDTGSGAEKKWAPTVRYLEEELPGYKVSMLMLEPRDIRRDELDEYLDLLIIDPAGYVLTAMRRQLIPLATMVQVRMGVGLVENGGVIFTRSDNRSLKSIDHLVGKSFLTTRKDDFFAWQTVYRELVSRRVAPLEDLTPLEFIDNEEMVVLGVLDGKAEAGAVSLGVLEEMALLGKIGLDSYRVLNPRLSEDPFERTTPTYPGWVCATFPHLAPGVADHLTKVLMEMPSGHPAAIAVRSAGWTEAGDYQKVHDCLSMVKIENFAESAEASWLEAALFLLVPLISLLGVLATYLLLSGKIRKLQKELSRTENLASPLMENNTAKMPADLAEEMAGLLEENDEVIDQLPPDDPSELASDGEQNEQTETTEPPMDTGDDTVTAGVEIPADEPADETITDDTEIPVDEPADETIAADEETPADETADEITATDEEIPADETITDDDEAPTPQVADDNPMPDEPATVEDLDDIVSEEAIS